MKSTQTRSGLACALVAMQVLAAPGLAWAQADEQVEAAGTDVAEVEEVETPVEGRVASEVEGEVESEVAFEEEDAYELDLYQIGATTLDVAVLRPLGGLTLLGGFAFFVASVPFVAPSEGIGATWDIFVYSSYDYAVLRPLGELF